MSETLRAVAHAHPEVELLLCSARVCLDAASTARLQALLQEDVNWAYLVRAADFHGTLPLLYWHLNATCPQDVPPATLAQLREGFLDNLRSNLFLTGELLKILPLLARHGIAALPFKGPTLTALAYGNLGFRNFGDLDILIPYADLPRARTLLGTLGYQPMHAPTGAQIAGWTQSACGLVHADTRTLVELHWEVLPRCLFHPPRPEHLRQRQEPVCLGGKAVFTLGREDLLLVLCLHGSKHLWGRLGWICDLAELLRVHPGLHWEQVLGEANRLHSQKMLFLGIRLARDLLNVAVPTAVVQEMEADPVVTALAAQVRADLFRDTAAADEALASCSFHLKLRPRLRDKLRCLHGLVVLPTVAEWTMLPLPRWLGFLYYLLRPLRLAAKYGRKLWQRVSALTP